jgi:hypothetical protein
MLMVRVLMLRLNVCGGGYKQNGDYMVFMELSVTWPVPHIHSTNTIQQAL